MIKTSLITPELKSEWYRLLAKAGVSDVYYLPEYLELYRQEGEPLLFAVETEKDCLVYPFLKRSLANLTFLDGYSQLKEYVDLISPYGYGGHYTSAKGEELRILVKSFQEEFNRYSSKERVVSQFVRFHPLLDNHVYAREFLDVTFNRPTITIDLRGGREEIWKRLTSSNRNRIRKAVKGGLLFREGKTEKDWRNFLCLYYLTMKAKQADLYYFFNSDYFRKLRVGLKDKVRLFLVEKDGLTIAAAVFLCSDRYLHYHLGGSDPTMLEFAPNNLLFFEVACWAAEHNRLKLHLGGGYESPYDDLYRFKKGFNREGSSSFFVGSRIDNRKIYDLLVQKRLAWGKELKQPNFFPLYRG
ncbi:MAG TPA: GNAT family N-acetyltransferase [Clostridia bacterium]|jgi:hypothetical protein|nr:GNAT family N-acetyltransferase [Clostridia bacterium]